jgi:hypothetical protein
MPGTPKVRISTVHRFGVRQQLNQKRGECSAGYGFTIDRETNPLQATEYYGHYEILYSKNFTSIKATMYCNVLFSIYAVKKL